MDSRKRFACACDHRKPDRVPLDFNAHPKIITDLIAFYDLKSEDELLDHLSCDFYYLSGRDVSQNETMLPLYRGPELPMTDTERTCPFGIRFTRGVGCSKWWVDEALQGPLESATTPQEVLDHAWPEPDWFDFEPLHAECEAHRDKVIVGGAWGGILGDSYRMHGFENFLLNLAMNPELIKTLVSRMAQFYLDLNQRIFEELGDEIDVWFFGNDFGSQEGLIFSPDMFEEFFFPHYKAMIAQAHSFGIKAMCHSCGGITKLIPRLIEAGVDILDPVQTTAANMEPTSLKQQFGDDIVFHGAIDTQHLLSRATPEEVFDASVRMIDVLGKDGGYILCSCNSIGPDIPLANIDAMYRAATQRQ